MNQWINYHHLYYFKAIAEEGSVSRAAEKLRVGQPTLSAQLKQFEETMGVALFERQHKKLILTEQGKVALDYARNIFKLGSEMLEVLHDRIRPERPNVGIGALDNIPKQVVLQMAKFALKKENCQITLREGRPDELLRELLSHSIDVMITDFLPTAVEAKKIFHRRITRQHVSIYGAKKYRELRKSFPRSIEGAPMIFPTYDSRLRYDLDHWSKTHSVGFDILIESQDIGVKKLMATEGLGLIPAAPFTVTSQVLSGELVEIGRLEGIWEELYFLSADRKIENPIAKRLMSEFTL